MMTAYEFDVLVMGAGLAGLRAALAAHQAGASVAVITKVHPFGAIPMPRRVASTPP